MDITSSFIALKSYCEAENFAGWDPYDGLNSKIFNALPFKHWDLARLAWIQGFKRSPINFRKLLLVPKEHNAKGIALFLSGFCNIYDLALKGKTAFGADLLQCSHHHWEEDRVGTAAGVEAAGSNHKFLGISHSWIEWQHLVRFFTKSQRPLRDIAATEGYTRIKRIIKIL